MEKILVLAPYNINLLKNIANCNLYDFIIVGDKNIINRLCENNNITISFDIYDCKDIIEVCLYARKIIKNNLIKKIIITNIPNILVDKLFDDCGKIISFYLLKLETDVFICNGGENPNDVKLLANFMIKKGIKRINASLLYPNSLYEKLELKIINMLYIDYDIKNFTLYDDISIHNILNNNSKNINLLILKNKDCLNMFIQSIVNLSNYNLCSYYLYKDITVLNAEECLDLEHDFSFTSSNSKVYENIG